ncbi:MAG TPA: hypothetical protein VME01_06160, partial [Solirubrobacteraceae bacterium]|nr:hypothetical protein [Solirubrobacteraceae bacterium]
MAASHEREREQQVAGEPNPAAAGQAAVTTAAPPASAPPAATPVPAPPAAAPATPAPAQPAEAGPEPGYNQTSHWFEAEPLWFKKAIFYEIHIRGFFDGNGDGSGDFRGLTEK